MDAAIAIISFYIWFMVHRKAFTRFRGISFKFLKTLDFGLIFAAFYIFFLAVTKMISVYDVENGITVYTDPRLLFSSTLNNVFLLMSCVYFGHKFVYFKNVKLRSHKLIGIVVLASLISTVLTEFSAAPSSNMFINYYSTFDAFFSTIALAVFSLGVAISFYYKGYYRFLPAFSIFAGLCYISQQVFHIEHLRPFIDANPVLHFVSMIVGFTSEIFIGILFLMIGKTWSVAYENDVDQAVIHVYSEMLTMRDELQIKMLLREINKLEKINNEGGKII
jgi:hypothetical protein